jgi:osmotically-inducible protein OsmY
MTRRISLLILILLPAVVCLAQVQVSDDQLFDNVRRALANDPNVKGGTLEVSVAEGVVTIRGVLETEKLRQRAEKVAGKVKGVKKIINQIKVEPVRAR